MSIGFTGIGEESISGQKTREPLTVVPGGGLPWALSFGIKAVVQKWLDERFPEVTNGREA